MRDAGFYFSHDAEVFDASDLIESVTRYAIYSDGSMEENGETLADLSMISIDSAPYMLYTEGTFTYEIELTITDAFGSRTLETRAEAMIGVKGDANLDGTVDANDAAVILVYAAEVGAGNDAVLHSDDAQTEALAKFLADVNGDGKYDATDAANILVYAAAIGAGNPVTWEEILGLAA